MRETSERHNAYLNAKSVIESLSVLLHLNLKVLWH